MYSTPEESRPPQPSHYNFRDRPDMRPSIEQIAMGLHISRAPHPTTRHSTSSIPRVRQHDIPMPQTPHTPPARTPTATQQRLASPKSATAPSFSSTNDLNAVSMKSQSLPPSVPLTPTLSNLSLSTPSLTSTAPSTPRSSRSGSGSASIIPARLHLRMSRLLPGRKGDGLTLTSSPRSLSPVGISSEDGD